MFDPLRREDDIVMDISKLNDICQSYKTYKALWTACSMRFGIEKAEQCECRDYKNEMTFDQRLHCPKCDGLGFIFHFKEDNKEKEGAE